MSVYQGTYFTQTFALSDTTGARTNVSTWTMRAMFRDSPGDADPLFELTTGDGLSIFNGPHGEILMELSDTRTLLMPVGVVHFDVLRTDGGNGDVYVFGGKVRVRQPITRDE